MYLSISMSISIVCMYIYIYIYIYLPTNRPPLLTAVTRGSDTAIPPQQSLWPRKHPALPRQWLGPGGHHLFVAIRGFPNS